MPLQTHFQPWGYGGKAPGSFAGRGGFVPATARTRFTPYGFGGKRVGLFTGRGAPELPGTRDTRFMPWGYGGKNWGSFVGRAPDEPIANDGGTRVRVSGATTGHRIIGDAGGPHFEYGEITITGAGFAAIQVGARLATGSGSFLITGLGDGAAIGSGEAIATGSGVLNFTGSGVAGSPIPAASGSGELSLDGAGAGAAVDPIVGDGLTLNDVVNAFANQVIDYDAAGSPIKRIEFERVVLSALFAQTDFGTFFKSVRGAKTRVRGDGRSGPPEFADLDEDTP